MCRRATGDGGRIGLPLCMGEDAGSPCARPHGCARSPADMGDLIGEENLPSRMGWLRLVGSLKT